MEWRDVAMSLLGILLSAVWWIVNSLKAELLTKVGHSDHDETRRRVTDAERNVGTLFSKVHDEEVKRLNQHITVVEMQNKNQSALLATLASITGRNINGNNGSDQ